MKWGTAFGPDWVNRLFAGVRRHLSIPHRFICFTDDARHLHPEIEAFPLPEVRVPVGETDLRWRKLAVFQQPLYDLEGPALFLDLDVVMVLRPIVSYEHLTHRSPDRRHEPRRPAAS
jgi:hypothetical protein